VKFGGKDAYETLAGVAIKNDRLDVVQNIVPRLMILKSAKQTPEEDKLNLISILLFYSIKTDRKDIFTKTLDGVDMKEVLQNDEVKKDIVSGCAYFEDEDTNKDIEKIRQEMESATGLSLIHICPASRSICNWWTRSVTPPRRADCARANRCRLSVRSPRNCA